MNWRMSGIPTIIRSNNILINMQLPKPAQSPVEIPYICAGFARGMSDRAWKPTYWWTITNSKIA